jgi:hypothetical protein
MEHVLTREDAVRSDGSQAYPSTLRSVWKGIAIHGCVNVCFADKLVAIPAYGPKYQWYATSVDKTHWIISGEYAGSKAEHSALSDEYTPVENMTGLGRAGVIPTSAHLIHARHVRTTSHNMLRAQRGALSNVLLSHSIPDVVLISNDGAKPCQ